MIKHVSTRFKKQANNGFNAAVGCLRIATMGFFQGCSTKPPPDAKVANELIELILMDGFATQNEPLLVTQPTELKHIALQASKQEHAKEKALQQARDGKGNAGDLENTMLQHVDEDMP
jgi:hypothetical protein